MVIVQILCPEYDGKLCAKISILTNSCSTMTIKQPLDSPSYADEHKFLLDGDSLDEIKIQIQIKKSKSRYKRMKS